MRSAGSRSKEPFKPNGVYHCGKKGEPCTNAGKSRSAHKEHLRQIDDGWKEDHLLRRQLIYYRRITCRLLKYIRRILWPKGLMIALDTSLI